MTLAERLSLIVERAPLLRGAGVQILKIDGIELVLAPPDAPEPKPAEVTKEPKGDLDDPMTYGSTERVPGFERPDDLPASGRR
jgi:hypothetical protein